MHLIACRSRSCCSSAAAALLFLLLLFHFCIYFVGFIFLCIFSVLSPVRPCFYAAATDVGYGWVAGRWLKHGHLHAYA